MIRFNCIDRIVDFDKYYTEWTTEIRVVLSVTDEKLIKKAKKIDEEYFDRRCFGIGFNYVHSENKMYLLGEGLYYVDRNGDDNYIKIDKDIILRLQERTEKEYKKYLDNSKQYLDEHISTWVEEV